MKILYETDKPSEAILQYFKDDATAFNAQKKGRIPGQRRHKQRHLLVAVSSFGNAGVFLTHFLEASDREMAKCRVNIIPVEVVIRNRAAGSITKRLGIAKGTTFNPP